MAVADNKRWAQESAQRDRSAVLPRSGTKYKQSARQSGGAEKWLDVRMWSSARDCLRAAKASGYQARPVAPPLPQMPCRVPCHNS